MTTFLWMSALLVVSAGLFVVPTLWRQNAGADAATTAPQRSLALGLMLGIAASTGAVYALVGQPDRWRQTISPEQPVRTSEPASDTAQDARPTPAQIEAMVVRLAQRLQSQPDDAAGWRMLARSYETLGRFDLAVQAYQRLFALQAPDADMLTDYAVTLGMSQERTLVGEPEAVIQQALRLNPRHVQALALSGSAAFERRDYALAVAQWNKLLAMIPADEPMRASIEGNVARARALAERDGVPSTP